MVPGGHFCRSGVNHFVGDDCRSLLCVLESGDWGYVYWGHSFFLFGTGDISDSWWFVLLVPREPPLIVSFVVPFVL